MTFKLLRFQLFAAFLVLMGSFALTTQAGSHPVGPGLGAVRQSIIQGVRDDIQRRIRRQRDFGQVDADGERPKSAAQKQARHPPEK
jgi:hypothetical protein